MLGAGLLGGCGTVPIPTTTPVNVPSFGPSVPVASTNTPISAAPTAPTPEVMKLPPELRGLTRGVLYAETPEAILIIDLSQRTVQKAYVTKLDGFKSFAATDNLLLVKQSWDGVGYTLAPSGAVSALPSTAGETGRIYPGGGRRAWIVPEEATQGSRRVRLIDVLPDGSTRLIAQHLIPDSFGIPESDGANNLIAAPIPGASYAISATAVTRLPAWRTGWQLVAAGGRSYLFRSCPTCPIRERSRARDDKAHATIRGMRALKRVAATYADVSGGLISSTGRWVALAGNREEGQRLIVIDLVTGLTWTAPGKLADENGNDQFAWLGSRWLLAITDTQLRVLDTKTGRAKPWPDVRISRIAVARV